MRLSLRALIFTLCYFFFSPVRFHNSYRRVPQGGKSILLNGLHQCGCCRVDDKLQVKSSSAGNGGGSCFVDSAFHQGCIPLDKKESLIVFDWMQELNRRLQVLLSEEQFNFIKDIARQRGQSMGDIVRNAVDRVYRPSLPVESRQHLQKLREFSLIAQEKRVDPAGDSIVPREADPSLHDLLDEVSQFLWGSD